MFLDIIRHAESLSVEAAEKAKRRGKPARYGGRQNHVDLSENGVRQSYYLGKFRVENGIEPVAYYSSPAKRAKRTFIEGLGVEPIIIDDLQERDWGKWTGELRSIADLPQYAEERARLGSKFAPPGGESEDTLHKRAVRAFWEIVSKHDTLTDDVVWVSSHRNLIGAILTELLGWSEEEAASKLVDVASRTRLKVVRRKVELVFINQPTQ